MPTDLLGALRLWHRLRHRVVVQLRPSVVPPDQRGAREQRRDQGQEAAEDSHRALRRPL